MVTSNLFGKTFYTFNNPDNGDVRVAWSVRGGYFVVVKILHGKDAVSIKYWRGSTIAKVSSYWSTTPGTISPQLVRRAFFEVAGLQNVSDIPNN